MLMCSSSLQETTNFLSNIITNIQSNITDNGAQNTKTDQKLEELKKNIENKSLTITNLEQTIKKKFDNFCDNFFMHNDYSNKSNKPNSNNEPKIEPIKNDKETTPNIFNKFGQFVGGAIDKGAQTIDNITDKVSDTISDTKDKIEDVIDDGKKKFNDTVNEIKQDLNNTKEEIKNEYNNFKEKVDRNLNTLNLTTQLLIQNQKKTNQSIGNSVATFFTGVGEGIVSGFEKMQDGAMHIGSMMMIPGATAFDFLNGNLSVGISDFIEDPQTSALKLTTELGDKVGFDIFSNKTEEANNILNSYLINPQTGAYNVNSAYDAERINAAKKTLSNIDGLRTEIAEDTMFKSSFVSSLVEETSKNIKEEHTEKLYDELKFQVDKKNKAEGTFMEIDSTAYNITKNISEQIPVLATTFVTGGGTAVAAPLAFLQADGETMESELQAGNDYFHSSAKAVGYGGIRAGMYIIGGAVNKIPINGKTVFSSSLQLFGKSLLDGVTGATETPLRAFWDSFVSDKDFKTAFNDEGGWESTFIDAVTGTTLGMITEIPSIKAKSNSSIDVDNPNSKVDVNADNIKNKENEIADFIYGGLEHKKTPEAILRNSSISKMPEFEQLVESISKKGYTMKEYGSLFNDTQNPEIIAISEALAKQKCDFAKNVEPGITEAMKSLETGNRSLVGLEYRLKGQSSMSRKIRTDAVKDGISMKEACDDIGDSIRYTMICDEDTIIKDINECINELQLKGYVLEKFKNTFNAPSYKGINTRILSPDGTPFELQFHTAQSFSVKEETNHLFYEIARNKEFSSELEQSLANKIMIEAASEINVSDELINLSKSDFDNNIVKSNVDKLNDDVNLKIQEEKIEYQKKYFNLLFNEADPDDKIFCETFADAYAKNKNTVVGDILENIEAIKKKNPFFGFYTTSGGSMCNGTNLLVNNDILSQGVEGSQSITNHEFGHALLKNFYEEFSGTNRSVIEDIITRSRSNADLDFVCSTLDNMKKEFIDIETNSFKTFNDKIKFSEKSKVEEYISELFNNNNIDELTNIVNNSKKSERLEKVFNNLGLNINDYDLEKIITDPDLVNEILLDQRKIEYVLTDRENMSLNFSEFGDSRKISSIINSFLQQENISSSDGKISSCLWCHSDNYWNNPDGNITSYDELFADFTSLKFAGREDALNTVRTILGDELYDHLENTMDLISKRMIEINNGNVNINE